MADVLAASMCDVENCCSVIVNRDAAPDGRITLHVGLQSYSLYVSSDCLPRRLLNSLHAARGMPLQDGGTFRLSIDSTGNRSNPPRPVRYLRQSKSMLHHHCRRRASRPPRGFPPWQLHAESTHLTARNPHEYEALVLSGSMRWPRRSAPVGRV